MDQPTQNDCGVFESTTVTLLYKATRCQVCLIKTLKYLPGLLSIQCFFDSKLEFQGVFCEKMTVALSKRL